MADAAGGFKNAPVGKAESSESLIHRPDNDWRGVMGVERRRARCLVFHFGEDFGNLRLLLSPVVGIRVEGLGQTAPPDVFHQNRLFLGSGRAVFGLNPSQCLDGSDIVTEFMLERSFAEPI